MRAGALAMLPLLLGCHAVIDPGRHVASDGGEGDAGLTDAGPGDAGPRDAGPRDAAPPDAAPPDAAPPDAGADAGLPTGECRSEADCDAPEACVFLAPELEGVGTCLTPCTSTADCGEQRCSLAGAVDPTFEHCSSDCDPTRPLEGCEGGLVCALSGPLPFCQPFRGRPEATQGEPCSRGAPCAVGHACINSGEGFTCREVCGAGTICPDGTTCLLDGDYGWCG